MNASFRIVALLALISASAALAEDAYFAIPLGELNITEGELPKPDQPAAQRPFPSVRAPWLGQWNRPYATLQGAGEAYVGALSGTDGPAVPAQVPGWLTSQRLVLRAPRGKQIQGHLFLPQASEADMTVVAFTVTPDQARSDATATFLRMKSEHYARLAEMGLPGGAWFRHQAEQARLPSPFAPTPFVAPPFPALRRRSPTDLASTYSLFTGGRAVAENLQLDRVLPPARTGTDTVSVDSISGVTVREIDWQPLIAGLAPVTDPLAALIPADQYAVFFPDAEAAAKVTDILSEGGAVFLRLADPRVEDLRTIARYEQQLGISIRDAAGVLKHLPVRSLALTGSDLYFAQGTDVAVLLETAEPEQLAALVLAQMGLKSLGDTTAEWSQGKVGEVEFRGAQNVDRSRSSYVAALPGAVVVTNSLYQLGRLASVKSGESAALATLPEYTFFRHQYPKGDVAETAFGMLSDAAIRRLCGPRWRIGASRRTRDAAVLMQLQAAHLEELALRNVTPRELKHAARLSAPGSVTLCNSGVVASPAGSLAFMTPIGELPLDRVTYAEAQAYEQWRRGYESNWTWAFDPMALRLSISEGQTAADLTVMPLIVATDYRPMMSITQGAELAPRAGDPHGALAHAALAINTESELFTLGRNVATSSFFGTAVDPFGWIGQSLSVYADDDPFWKELAAVSPQDRERFLLSEGWRLPVGVQVEIANGLKLIPVLAAVRTLVEQTAAGMTRWETRSYLDEPYTRVSLTERGRRGQPELEKAAIYYAAAGDALVISPSEDVLKRALERQIQRGEDKEDDDSLDLDGQPWLGQSVGVQIDTKLLAALVQFGHQEYQAMMQARAWGNIPILNEWKQRYPDQDAQKLHERLWHSRLVCPGGGQYQWNAQWGTFESTVYGHPGQPKQGPTVPPALSAFARGNFGLTFEHQGLRARVMLDRPADVPEQPVAPASPDEPPSP